MEKSREKSRPESSAGPETHDLHPLKYHPITVTPSNEEKEVADINRDDHL